MRLSALLEPEHFCPPEWDRDIEHIVSDSRAIEEGDLFVCRVADQDIASRYIEQAVAQGAAAVVTQGEMSFRCQPSSAQSTPVFSLPDVISLCPVWLQRRYRQLDQLNIIGITGTNGKSSVSQYIAQILTTMGVPCGVIGTLGNGVWPDLNATLNTTPDITIVYRQLAQMADAGVEYVAMEVSSHGIDQGRVAGLAFRQVLVTNISRDHLDYHGSFDAYAACKKRLIDEFAVQDILLNADDKTLQAWLATIPESQSCASYGESGCADYRYQDICVSDLGLAAKGVGKLEVDVDIPLMGTFNLANTVAAIAALSRLGFEQTQLTQAAQLLLPANGRMEVYQDQQGRRAIIDFAHTPDALSNVLAALQSHHQAISLVFGCGGDRDRGKRPQMAQAALYYADRIWLTDDNPRTEDPEQIFTDVCAVDTDHRIQCIHDRSEAISSALAACQIGDLLVITGKGHEAYQDIADVKVPYSDAATLQQLGFSRSTQLTQGEA